MYLDVQRMHFIFGEADGLEKGIVRRKTAVPHPTFQPVEVAKHRLEFILQRSGLFFGEISALHNDDWLWLCF
jgi:hypothetical protein